MFEWAAIGGVVFALFIFCARIMRRGLSTLDDVRHQHMEKIDEGRRLLAEDSKKISAAEQFHLLEAAIADLIRLSPEPSAWHIRRNGKIIELASASASWQIELAMVERALRSSGRILHGKPRWLLRGDGVAEEQYTEIAHLMASLNRRLRADTEPEKMPPHLARRIAGARAARHDLQQKSWKD